MQKEKLQKEQKSEVKPNAVDYYASFKGKPMVRISGNFMKGGFMMSKNKVIAVLALAEELKSFAAGAFDEEIKSLAEDEVLRPNK